MNFSWYPHDALYNLGHYTAYFVGLIISTLLCANRYRTEKKLAPQTGEQAELQ